MRPIDILHLIDRLEELVSESVTIPLADRSVVEREKLLELIDQMRGAIPEDIQHAEEVLRSQEELLAEAREAAQRISEEAESAFRQRLDQHELVQAARTEAQVIVAKAKEQGQTLLAQAEEEAYLRRKELDEYSLTLLRRLEANLTSQLANVHSGVEGILEGKTHGPGASHDVTKES